MVTTQTLPNAWSDVRLAEACTRMASAPTTFGVHASAWRAAATRFTEAQRAVTGSDPEQATGLRAEGFRTLHAVGLRMEQAMTGPNPADTASAPQPPVSAAQQRAQGVTEYTARLLHLRREADDASASFTERAAVQYGAASCYERAVREWTYGRESAAHAWMRAAEQTLAGGLVPAPWHPQPVPPPDA